MNNIYPWQFEKWQQCTTMRARLPHAILLHGRAGIGKFHFAQALSQSLLCQSPQQSGHACGACQSCHWFKEDAHPDFRLLTPEQEGDADGETESSKKKSKKKSNISVAQVRDLNDFIQLSSHQAQGYKIVLIHPAEALNISSANALLKMLEEPASNVIFILVAHQIHKLLPTILSRCHQIAMPAPDVESAANWLSQQGVTQTKEKLAYFANAPMTLLEQVTQKMPFDEICGALAQGPKLDTAQLASQLTATQVEAGLNSLQKWLYDLISIKSGCELRYHLAYAQALQALAGKVNLNGVFELQKKVSALKNLALHPLNHALQVECLLLEYTKLFSTK
jgi:DNA polymerase-3 subunit delta'